MYHLPLYSLLSTSTEAVISAPLCKENWSILSPHRLMQTLRGIAPGFQYKFLFAPAVAAAPCSGHFRQELNDLACDFHVAML